MKRSQQNREVNVWVSKSIPVLLLGIIGYVSWVITKAICIDYLLSPPTSIFARKQAGAAIAILIIYYLLLIFMLVCYGRLIDTVTRHPGLVPRGRQWHIEDAKRKASGQARRRGNTTEEEKNWESESTDGQNHLAQHKISGHSDEHPQTEDFWLRDVFVCKYDGRPEFCSTCYNWKPDRAHHCSELNRCVLKMDHFCPWVGGVVGETSFKFFIQFTFWAALFCLHALIVTAYFLAQRKHAEDAVNAHWAVTLGLASLFFLFSAGMCLSSVQFAFINSTTIENLSRKQKVWYLAIYVPDHILLKLDEPTRDKLRLISYPRPPHEHAHMFEQSADNEHSGTSSTSPDTRRSTVDVPSPSPQRTFGIFATRPGQNPWDIGPVRNYIDVMGYRVWDWLVPIQPSPCTQHNSRKSLYKLGPVVQQIKDDAGISYNHSNHAKSPDPGKRRRHRRHSSRRSRSQRQTTV